MRTAAAGPLSDIDCLVGADLLLLGMSLLAESAPLDGGLSTTGTEGQSYLIGKQYTHI